MNTVSKMKWLSYFISGAILIFSFLWFYSDTHEVIGSLVAALLSAALSLVSLIMLRWLVQVF
jgi:hypothetical protein